MSEDRFVDHPELKIFGGVWLHGSRNMATRGLPWENRVLPEGTDWDYAAQHKQPWQQMDEIACKRGWVEVVDKSYMDDNTAFVYEKIIDGEKVQVSMRQCLKTYKNCFSCVNEDFYFKYLWKGSPNCMDVIDRRKFWNTLYRVHEVAGSPIPTHEVLF